MKSSRVLLLPLLVAVAAAAADPTGLPAPSLSQTAWHDAEIGLFVHWAPNVYQGTEGDNLTTPRNRILPDRFDAAEIARLARSAHAGYVIFVAKHVGGYCAWPTATTDYSLASSPWRNGKGDMVGDLAQACREQNLRFGVYLSPKSGIHHVGGGGKAADDQAQRDYNGIYRRQLTEILTRYGPMFEMWFDGGNLVPVNDLIDLLAPEIITFQGRRANSTRWVGNEQGFAPYPCWNTIAWREGETPGEGAGRADGNLWCPAECDVSILRPNWFWKPGSDARILSLDTLMEIYYLSVGRGVNLLLNIAPDDHGAIPAAQARRLKEFGDEIAARFGEPLGCARGQGPGAELALPEPTPIDHLRLREDIRYGERVRKFTVEGRGADGEWRPLVRGSQIGARQIFPIPPTRITAVRVMVEESVGPAVIRDLAVYFVNRPVPPAALQR